MVELTREHMRIVQSVRWHCFRALPHRMIDDLLGAGMEGLAKAALTFDPEKGKSFRNYAWFKAHHAMQDHLRRTEGHRTVDGQLVQFRPTMVAAAPTSRVFNSPVDPIAAWETSEDLDQAICALSARERYAVRMVCLQGHTLASVGRTLGITESGVCLLIQRAQKRMRVSLAA